MRIAFMFCCLLLLCRPVMSQVRLPRLVSDGMVLQRDVPVKIWGWAAAGEKVTLHFLNKEYTVTTGGNGKWMVLLAPVKAGGPVDMQIDASNHIVIKNILIGDIWVCSGQSNMELPMERLKDRYPDIIARSANTMIRQFNVATRYVFQSPQDDLVSGAWEQVNPESILHFTATGYFFAKALYEKYKVPVGLIKSCVGGSPAEAWLSEEALKAFPEHLQTANKYKDNAFVDSIKKADATVNVAWYRNIFQQDKGMQETKKWFDPAYNASGWPEMELPGYWENQGLPHTNGVVWFRKEIEVPAAMAGKPARLFLGSIVDRDSVYLNGVFIGTTGYQYPPRKYPVPAGLLKQGKNLVVIRVINYAGSGGFYKDKPYQLVTTEQTIDLKGKWQYQLGAAMAPIPAAVTFQYMPGGLYNAMIAPLLPYAIKGVIWYQGESNTARPKEYRQLFPAVINNWRKQWQQGDFPFLYVQLANYMQIKELPAESNWAELREAQLKTLSVPNTGMIVTTDIGEWNDVHPLNKEDVGKRLALAARKIAYGDKTVIASGPVYQSMKIAGNKIVLSFSNVGAGLVAQGSGVLQSFAIAGADQKFVWANAVIEKDKIVVWQKGILHPVAVRYAWADNPQGANLYNKENLPASPFRTGDPVQNVAGSAGLKDVYRGFFPIGVAVSPASLQGTDSTLIVQQFNSITPENAMKMGPVHPKEHTYYWKDADAIVDFAQRHHLKVRGHALCWHEQTPDWLFTGADGKQVSKEVLLQRLKEHIYTVVSRYKGKVYAWDVVNEAVDDDSTRFLRNSLWYQICGDEFIIKAFQYAHEADPAAILFYNDYNSERPEKRERIYKLLKQLKEANVPVQGVGLQAHWSLSEPTEIQLRTAIEQFASLGVTVQFTEVDMSVYSWEKEKREKRPGESDAYSAEKEQQQADQYKMVFRVFREYKKLVSGVTFWNITDKTTWLDHYPVEGRKNYPLLFGQDGKPKKAYYEVTRF